MKKQLSFILALVLIFSLFAPAVVSATSIPAEVESNNGAATANDFTAGAIRGSLSEGEDVDFFKFNVTNDDYYTLSFRTSVPTTNVGDGWDVIIYDSNLNKLYSFTTTNNHTTPRFCIPGTIYVEVHANDQRYDTPLGVSYDLTYTGGTDDKWENELNDANTSANPIAINTTYRGSLHLSNDADWFVVTPLDYFSVSLERNKVIPTDFEVGDGWTINVYDSTLSLLTSFETTTAATSRTFPVGGPVFIEIVATDSNWDIPNHVYYNLTVNSAENAVWEDEYNDESTTANTIKQGTAYIGNLQSGKDVDYFKVMSTTKAIAVNFSIDLSEVEQDSIGDGWMVTVYPANSGKSIASCSIDSVGSFKSITLPYEKGAYYYVKVEAVDPNYDTPIGQPYHISVVDASAGKDWEVETGMTGVSAATTLKEGKVIYGNLANGKDQDYFKCKVVSGGTIKIDFKRVESDKDGDGYKITVKNAAGTVVFTDKVDDLTSKSFSGIKVSKGNYYIIVEAVDSSWDVPSAEIDYNLSFALTLNKPSIKSITPTKTTLKASWTKKTDVTGYQIQYATNKNFTSAKTVTATGSATSATIKSTSATKVYYIRIRTYVKDTDKTYYSAWSTVKIAVNTPTVKKVTPSKGTLKVSWDKNSGATSYEIQYSTSKSFSKAKTVKTSSSSVTIKNVSKNKTYYVRIRTVVKSTTTYYSLWSSAYSIKAK